MFECASEIAVKPMRGARGSSRRKGNFTTQELLHDARETQGELQWSQTLFQLSLLQFSPNLTTELPCCRRGCMAQQAHSPHPV
eukprot:354763-Chlamydomonas_euryale.AAC.5